MSEKQRIFPKTDAADASRLATARGQQFASAYHNDKNDYVIGTQEEFNNYVNGSKTTEIDLPHTGEDAAVGAVAISADQAGVVSAPEALEPSVK